MKTVAWFSTGVSSFISIYLTIEQIDEINYIHIEDQHLDSLRYLKECEEVLHKKINILQGTYKTVEEVCKKYQYIKGVRGAKCTDILKVKVRKQYENAQTELLRYIWGMDCTEKNRACNLEMRMPLHEHYFPLIERSLNKQDCHAILAKLNIKRPLMYDMGYQNNNCLGCVKGGMWYWNKIRVDFPQVFEARAKLEREIGASCINGIYLDELEPNRGRAQDEISQECGISCMLNL